MSGIALDARMADVAIGSEDEEEDTDINFRAERDHIGEGLYLLGAAKTVPLF